MTVSKIFYATCLFILSTAASAQSCPTENPNGLPKESAAVALHGKVVYHDDLRQWFGLRLGTPTCGQRELQLIAVNDKHWKDFEQIRGCGAEIRGVLNIAGTGYYSTEIFQVAEEIHPDSSCIRQPPFPDMSRAKPNPGLRRYQVKIAVSYANGGSIRAEAHVGGKLLTPWKAYTSYTLTGGFTLWGNCHEGFAMNHVSGSPEANPLQTDDDAAIDPESAKEKNVDPILMTFTCTRRLLNKSAKSESKHDQHTPNTPRGQQEEFRTAK